MPPEMSLYLFLYILSLVGNYSLAIETRCRVAGSYVSTFSL